ncbi:glycosyltransferase family 2 protein [Agarivorans sp. Alg241-V36]|uniref:glycosyltransferase family 2 protein n=1 Tax=Agarivorans sp. Alg241-V36 TaxID=2305992 RepID=UPI0013CF5FDB|nr:glycosyltransferase family 2 protein [Agarivorans sp. Alg241-V36]
METKTSVVIPYFNNQQFISQAVNSVMKQTLPALELIIVNDGSTKEAREYLEQFSSVATIVDHSSNLGIAAARNNGVKTAKGEFIAFLDADDYWDKHKLALQQEIMESEPELSGCHCATNIFSQEGEAVETCDAKPLYLSMSDSLVDSHIVPSSWLVKRKDFIEAKGFDSKVIAEDYDLFLTLLARGHRYKFIAKPLVWFRRANQGNESGRWQYIFYGRLKVFKKHRRDLYKEGGAWALCNNLQRTFELAAWRTSGSRYYIFRLFATIIPNNYK